MSDTNPAALPLAGERVVLCGRFATLGQRQLTLLIQRLGGKCLARPGRHTTRVVRGQGSRGKQEKRPRTLEAALRLQAVGCHLQIVNEEEFLRQLGVFEPAVTLHGRFTLLHLAELIKTSVSQVRHWVRAGLLEPAEEVHGIPLFQYRQLVDARFLAELARSPTGWRKLRQTLRQLRRKVPGAQPVIHAEGIFFRLSSGPLVERSGQLRLEFRDSRQVVSVSIPLPVATSWVEHALDLERRQEYSAADQAYAAALTIAPEEPLLHFNRANVLYHSGALEEALDSFRRAVRLDATFAEAWNNLGGVLAELGDGAGAVAALERAVGLAPGYADAHYNLAETLEALGRHTEARRHWLRVVGLQPTGTAADRIRQKLGSVTVGK